MCKSVKIRIIRQEEAREKTRQEEEKTKQLGIQQAMQMENVNGIPFFKNILK